MERARRPRGGAEDPAGPGQAGPMPVPAGRIDPQPRRGAARLPHPIPYQGSKRALAPRIGRHVPEAFGTWFEPFAGSAAMTLWVARHRAPRRIVLGDASAPLCALWAAIIAAPEATARRYAELWHGQATGGPDHFDRIRARFNREGDPVDLLYLVCRCVKNAVRFNAAGGFTQSVDRRRLGTRPERMADAIAGAAALLRGRTEIRQGDWMATLADAGPGDFAYLDPPYLGTSLGRDRRYAQQMAPGRLVEGLSELRVRGVPFALSYDGQTGERSYGPPLPASLGLTRLLLPAGRSSQATLSGRAEQTVESLYLSPGLA